jgi:hypothetical protein
MIPKLGQSLMVHSGFRPSGGHVFSQLLDELIELPGFEVLLNLLVPLGVFQFGQDDGGHRILLGRAELVHLVDSFFTSLCHRVIRLHRIPSAGDSLSKDE